MNPRYHYINIKEKNRRVTLAYDFDKTTNTARVGWSICNQEGGDEFYKTIGRRIARGRYECERTTITIPLREDSTTWYGRMYDVYKFLSEDEKVHPRLRKYMRLLSVQRIHLSTQHLKKALNCTAVVQEAV